MTPPLAPLARDVLALLRRERRTLGVAESLTGGLLGAVLTAVPGSSDVLRGGVLAYATDLKATLLGVDADLLAREGPVHPDVAAQMASGVARLVRSDVGLATTGVAGPGPQDGVAAGTVFVAGWTGQRSAVARLGLTGGREQVRLASVEAVLRLALRTA